MVGQAVALTLTNAQVPGYPQATTFTYAFDCGTGTYGAASSSNSASCPTSVGGPLAVRGKVIDQDGDAGEYSATVTVLTATQETVALSTAVAGSTLAPDLRAR